MKPSMLAAGVKPESSSQSTLVGAAGQAGCNGRPPSVWTRFKQDDCPICSKRGWCRETRTGDGGRVVECMRVHEPARPGFLRSKPNRSGDLASYYRLDGVAIGLRLIAGGNGKHKSVEPAGEKTRHAAYAALCEVLTLSDDHKAALLDRGLTEADIEAGRYRTLPAAQRSPIAFAVLDKVKTDGIKTGELLRVPGFIRRDDVPIALAGRAGLLIPIMTGEGTIASMVLRPDHPALDPQGRPLGKYTWFTSSSRSGPGAVAIAHVPPGVSLPAETVRITEGPLKAAIAQSKTGLPTLGLPGVRSWQLALPVLKSLGAHRVQLAFDADAGVNPNVAGALARACRKLVAAGYEVEVERWDATHKGIDDALVAGTAIEILSGLDAVRFALDITRRQGYPAHVELDQVLAWVRWYFDCDQAKAFFHDTEVLDGTKRLRDRAPVEFASVETILRKHKLWSAWNRAVKGTKQSTGPKAPALPYVERDGCTYSVFQDREGNLAEKKIADFTCRIVREIARHEAGEIHKHLEVKATHRDGTFATATIRAEDFEPMAWITSELGSKFAVEPGRGTRDLMRHAVQILSHRDAVEFHEVFTALGWHTIGEESMFLHAGGGIGAAGPVVAHVEAEKALAAYRLPEPDEGRLAQAIEQVLLTHALLGAQSIASIVVSLPYRAVLGPTRFTPHFSGTTGTFKTSTACLAARFFAPGLEHSDPMPATWSSTVNGIQRLQYDAGDMVLVVDNLVADGDQASRELYKADLVFNTQGDLAGRRRMKPDGTLAAVLDPRTSLISTGECDPRRRSALGRSLVVEFEPALIDFNGLKRCHEAARDGHYALTIACYVQHLAASGRLETQRQALRRLALDYQSAAIKHTPECHPRQAEAVAELITAWQLFLEFAVEKGALTRDRAHSSVNEVRDQLFDLLAVQATIQTESDPGELFLDLVRSLLASKRAVLSATDGTMPPIEIAGACGWERVTTNSRDGLLSDWQPVPGAARIGWVDDAHVYLDPAVAHAATERLARETHQVLGTQRQVLTRLAETNRIRLDQNQAGPGERRRFTRRAIIEKSRRRVIEMHRDEVLALEPAAEPTSQPDTEPPF